MAIGAFDSVPIEDYTKAWLINTELLEQVDNRLVFLKNEQQVLLAVESRHAETGIVYRSSLSQSASVRIIATPSIYSYPRL
jgi:ABC-type molybdate transport system substrate-binding protein